MTFALVETARGDVIKRFVTFQYLPDNFGGSTTVSLSRHFD
jgi:hypothetical protein